MKLVEAPLVSVEKHEVPPCTIDENQTEPIFFIGKRTFHNVFIQLEVSDDEFIKFGPPKTPEIIIGPYHLYGVIPFRWESRDQKIIECIVDGFELV